MIQKILQLCERQAVMVPVLAGGGNWVDRLRLGPTGELLRHNVLNEWLLCSVISPEESVFLCRLGMSDSPSTNNFFSEELKEQYSHVKDLSGGQLPFGLAVMRQRCAPEGVPQVQEEARYFEPSCREELRLCLFTAPGKSAQHFHRWQRLRKMWWRKFSASPGRFSLTDARSLETCQSVDIQATFSWGAHAVETITLHTSVPSHTSITSFEARDGRRKVLPHVVECVTFVERALFTFLCDAYNEVEQREALRLHRRLAPYKVAVAATPCSEAEELGRLATYLGRLLRRAGVCVLLLPDVTSKSLESQFVRNDVLGVPYTAVLNPTTLKTGIVGLRSRDTALKEQVHISELKNYIELILKNY